jgi:hypothetical protein
MQEQDSLLHELLAQVAGVAPLLTERAAESEKLEHLEDVSWVLFGRHVCLASFLLANWVETKPIP